MPRSLSLLSAPYQSGKDWHRVCEDAISFPRARGKKGSKGPRSLVDVSLRVLADNMENVSYDTLCGLSERLLRRLFKEVFARNMPLRTWDMLSRELQFTCWVENSTMTMAMRRYCEEIVDPPCELSVYTTPLAALSDCLVYLCIDNVARFESHELLALAKLENLAVLELVERGQSTAIHDRLVRGWQEVRGEGLKPFPSLRVLKITSRWHAISPSSLEHILEFARLEIFDITALPSARWRKVGDGKGYVWSEDTAWNLTEPKGSLLASYARAYLDGTVAVDRDIAEPLKSLFEDDKQEVVLVKNPRAELSVQHYKQWARRQEEGKRRRAEKRAQKVMERNRLLYGDDVECHYKQEPWVHNQRVPSDGQGDGKEEEEEEKEEEEEEEEEEGEREHVDLNEYLDGGWRAVLKGSHLWSAPTDAQDAANLTNCNGDLTDDQVFWFLALLDQKEYDGTGEDVQVQVEGMTMFPERFASLRLRGPANTETHSRERLNANRLIFSRGRGDYVEREAELELVGKSVGTLPTFSIPAFLLGGRKQPRPKKPEERRLEDLKPRKRQKMGDLLSSFQP